MPKTGTSHASGIPEKLPGRERMRIVPGSLATTLHPAAIDNSFAQILANCNPDRGIWELDKRYRLWQTTPGGDGFGFGYGYFNGTERVLAFTGGKAYQADGVYVETGLGSSSSEWSSALEESLATSDWIVWQADKYLFGANPDSGLRYIQIGGTDMGGFETTTMPQPTKPLIPRLVLPPYFPLFKWNDTSGGRAATVTVASGTIAQATNEYGVTGRWTAGVPAAEAGSIWTVEFDNVDPFALITDADAPRGFLTFFIESLNTNCRINSTGVSSPDSVVAVGIDDGSGSYDWLPVQYVWDPSPNTYFNKLYVTADLRTSRFAKSALSRRIQIKFHFSDSGTSANPQWRVSTVYFGGQHMDRIDDNRYEGQVELSYAYLNPGTGVYSPPAPSTLITQKDWLRGTHHWFGSSSFTEFSGVTFNSMPTLGTGYGMGVDLNYGSVSSPALQAGVASTDKIVYLRKIKNRWYKFSNGAEISGFWTLSNKFFYDQFGHYVDGFQFLSRVTESPAQYALFDFSHNLSNINNPICGVAWKGSNVVFTDDGLSYCSRVNSPFEFFVQGQTPPEIDPRDIYQPRTVQWSDAKNPIIAAVSQDALYGFSRREAYVMTGPTPYQGSRPRRLPGTDGIVGRRAADRLGRGAVYGTDSGLFYVWAPNTFGGDQGEFEIEELTEGQRATYKELLGVDVDGDSWSSAFSSAFGGDVSATVNRTQLIVVVHEREIWAICQDRYMRRTKQGNWTHGTLTSEVKAAWADPERGIIIQLKNGKMGVFGDYVYDEGTDVTGTTNGTAISWRWRSKRFTDPTNIQRMLANVERDGNTPANVTVKVFTDRAMPGFTSAFSSAFSGSAETITFTGAKAWESFEAAWALDASWWEIEMEGENVDRVISSMIEVSPGQSGGYP